ncbi:MAG: T9SS type B sorting domain-containing protein [Flavobacteriaceae bacterium]|nr:MAG: T9SS type B sorting domain-containing protein [Flavobacteriaceae bacterium]
MSAISHGQDISLFQQFNGRYDYKAFGNTLNSFENNLDDSFCEILPSSQATLNLTADQTVIAAYLYWAGSGEADTTVNLNGSAINSDLNYSVTFNSPFGELLYFSCVTDITDVIVSTGNGTYEFSELDISGALLSNPGYCSNRTNFAGWSIYVIYEDLSLPLNQVSLFQGLEIINTNVTEKIILLENINVLDNQGAKIGFLAWEGDDALNYGESLSINDNILSNPPLNLSDNAFNGTNTFTNSSDFYNVDLDVYDIQNNIAIGDTSATIKLTTGDFDENGVFRADLIILNNIITVLNSQLPDATIAFNPINASCNSSDFELTYTVSNLNSTDSLPANTPIAFYIDGILIAQNTTLNIIEIGSTETNSMVISIPEFVEGEFELLAVVDDDGTGNGTVNEIVEINNSYIENISLLSSEPIIELDDLLGCDQGFNSAAFDLSVQLDLIDMSFDTSTAKFYLSVEDAQQQINEIIQITNFTNTLEPQIIFIRVESLPCYQLFQFLLNVENCPPVVPQGFSPNEDGYNDWFNIQGLYDIFENHELLIYNRYGSLIFKGDNSLKWRGRSNKGLNDLGKLLPVGTYFYVLHLNDPDFESLAGWVYLNY